MGHKIEADGQEFDLTPENSVVNLFRNGPDFDYITYVYPGTEQHMAFFSGTLTRWLGGIALTTETRDELKQVEADLGVYGEIHGGYPRVIIDDHPSEHEFELRVRGLLGDDLEHIHELMEDEHGES